LIETRTIYVTELPLQFEGP